MTANLMRKVRKGVVKADKMLRLLSIPSSRTIEMGELWARDLILRWVSGLE